MSGLLHNCPINPITFGASLLRSQVASWMHISCLIGNAYSLHKVLKMQMCVMHMFLLHRNDVIMRVYSWPKAKSLTFLHVIPGKTLVYRVITIH